MPPGSPGFIDEIPGDNAAYRRAALQECQAEIKDGFWETLVHVRLRANGQKLLWVPGMRVRLGKAGTMGSTAGLRFRHGRHYGSTRPGNTLLKRFTRLLASPLIVPTLLARIVGRVRRQHPDWTPQLLSAFPALLVLLSSWALGEVSGYLSPQKGN